jgi:hypothetical protein
VEALTLPSVIPFLIRLNPCIALCRLSVNSSVEIINCTSPSTKAWIIAWEAPVALSVTVIAFISVVPNPAKPCGPTRIYVVPSNT